jgi:hypothetical protein
MAKSKAVTKRVSKKRLMEEIKLEVKKAELLKAKEYYYRCVGNL